MKPSVAHHFPNGELVIVGELKAGEISIAAIAAGNPGGALHFRGSAREMAGLFARAGRLALRAMKRGR